MKVIGRHCYAAGMTETALLAAAGRTGTAAATALTENKGEEAAYKALQAASYALDATEPGRGLDDIHIHTVWTPKNEDDRPPRYGDVLAEHRPWGWKVIALGTLREHRGGANPHSPLNGVIERLLKKDSADTQSRSQREHARKPQPALYSADVYARIVQSYTAPVPTPRNITFGFWGTWKHNNSRMTQPTAWDAVFRVHGSGRTWPDEDHHLAAVLDSATGRHYADQVAGHHPKNDDELDQALRDAGDPRDLWQKQNHHKQSAGATS